jgi:hypothetical protein
MMATSAPVGISSCKAFRGVIVTQVWSVVRCTSRMSG